jgi:hypothetical protein
MIFFLFHRFASAFFPTQTGLELTLGDRAPAVSPAEPPASNPPREPENFHFPPSLDFENAP